MEIFTWKRMFYAFVFKICNLHESTNMHVFMYFLHLVPPLYIIVVRVSIPTESFYHSTMLSHTHTCTHTHVHIHTRTRTRTLTHHYTPMHARTHSQFEGGLKVTSTVISGIFALANRVGKEPTMTEVSALII